VIVNQSMSNCFSYFVRYESILYYFTTIDQYVFMFSTVVARQNVGLNKSVDLIPFWNTVFDVRCILCSMFNVFCCRRSMVDVLCVTMTICFVFDG